MAKVKEQVSAVGELEAEIDNILDDLGVGEEGTPEEVLEMRAAVRAFIIKQFSFHVEDSGIEPCSVGELQYHAQIFWEGYEACLEKHR